MKTKNQETINLKEIVKDAPIIELDLKNQTTFNPNELRKDILRTLMSAIKKGFIFAKNLLKRQYATMAILAIWSALLFWADPNSITQETLAFIKEAFMPANLFIPRMSASISIMLAIANIVAFVIKNNGQNILIKKLIIKEILMCIIINIFNLLIVKSFEMITYLISVLVLATNVMIISGIYYYFAIEKRHKKAVEF